MSVCQNGSELTIIFKGMLILDVIVKKMIENVITLAGSILGMNNISVIITLKM